MQQHNSGFYKFDSGVLLYGPKFILNQYFELREEQHETYQYPVDGWYWFDDRKAAYDFFDIPYIETNQGIERVIDAHTEGLTPTVV